MSACCQNKIVPNRRLWYHIKGIRHTIHETFKWKIRRKAGNQYGLCRSGFGARRAIKESAEFNVWQDAELAMMQDEKSTGPDERF